MKENSNNKLLKAIIITVFLINKPLLSSKTIEVRDCSICPWYPIQVEQAYK